MLAYFIHNQRKTTDTIYIPELGCFVAADRAHMEKFISEALSVYHVLPCKYFTTLETAGGR